MNITIHMQPQRTLYGLWETSSDRTIAKDIPRLSQKYYTAAGKTPKSVLPFYVLTKDYDPKSGVFQLFIGGELENSALERYCLPEAVYGKVFVRPRFGFLWGFAVGKTKRDFYTKWLPESGYEPLNMEYEYHTEKSVGKKAEIDLFFALKGDDSGGEHEK